MFRKLKKVFDNDVDFTHYQQKEKDFKRLALINIIACIFILPPFCFLVYDTEIPFIYFKLGLSYIISFPIYILICWLIPFFRDKLFQFFVLHLFIMTFVAFISLVENNVKLIDLISFYCLFAICIFVIQRLYYGILYISFVLLLTFLSFYFIDFNNLISARVVIAYILILSSSGLLSLYMRNGILVSLNNFNSYLNKITQGNRFGYFIFEIVDDKVNIIQFDQENAEILTQKKENTNSDLSFFFNKIIPKTELKKIARLDEDEIKTIIQAVDQKNYEISFSPLLLNKERYYVLKTTDVTKFIEKNEQLKRSETKYKNLYNESLSGVFTLNKHFKLQNFNNTFRQIFEDSFQIGDSFITENIELNEIKSILKENQKINNYQIHFKLVNKSIKWLVFNFLYDEISDLIEGNVIDISEVQKTISELRKSEKKYKLIYNESSDAILVIQDKKIVDLNRKATQLFGIPKEEFINQNLWSFTHYFNEDLKKQLRIYLNKLKYTNSVKFNWIFNGRYHPIEVEVSIVELLINNKIAYQIFIHDVTEKNKTIRLLEESTNNFKFVLDGMPTGIFILKDEDIIYSNKEIHNLSSRKQLDISNLFTEEDQIKFNKLIQNKRNTQAQLSFKSKTNTITCSVIIRKFLFGMDEVLLVLIKDLSFEMKISQERNRALTAEELNIELKDEINNRKRIEKELKDLLLRTNLIYESSSNVLITTINLNNKVTYINKHAKSYFKEKINKEIQEGDDLSDMFSNSHTEEFITFIENVFSEIKQGKSVQYEYKIYHADSDKFSWLEVFFSPIVNSSGNITEFCFLSHDITAKKENEREIINQLNEKEILLKEIHHRVKNNLQVISSILNLQSSFVQDEKTLEIIQESRNRIRTMATIHENLYQTKNFESIDFSNYIKDLTSNLRAIYQNKKNEIDIIYDFSPINISLNQAVPLGLIINELITNALKYAFIKKKGNTLLIQCKEEDNRIFVRIKDNGVGLALNFNLDKLETLGLQLVTALVDQLEAEFSYQVANGTEFLISFDKESL